MKNLRHLNCANPISTLFPMIYGKGCPTCLPDGKKLKN